MGFVCLAYHRVAQHQASRCDPYAVTPTHLRAHLAWLARWGYSGCSLATLINAGKNQQCRSIALTFDDGYLDFYTTAWPILQEFGFGATVFVVTESIGQIANWAEAPVAPLMSWNEIQRLVESGVEIGAHGARHRPLDMISSDERRADLSQAYHTLSTRFGYSSIGLAYPYGRWSPQAAAAVANAGFEWGCTARGGVNHPWTPLFKLRRTLIRSQTSLLQFACQVGTGYARWCDWRMDVRRIP